MRRRAASSRCIRASSTAHPAADIIVITIFAEQAKVLNSIKAGARGYLLKDDMEKELLTAIETLRQGDTYLLTWITGDEPLLFDRAYAAKPAYAGVLNALSGL